jgi:hypothetical protein
MRPLLLLALVLAAPLPVQAAVELEAELLNFILWRNDSDFDRTRPAYDQSGQSVGVAATLLRPAVTWRPTAALWIRYEAELGLNVWSRNNPDQADPTADDAFLLKHREAYAAGELFDRRLGFVAGYHRAQDPTGLFVDHWLGGGQLAWTFSAGERLRLLIAELPDQTYEGISVLDNNFRRDVVAGCLDLDTRLAAGLDLWAGLAALYDDHLPGQRRWHLGPTLRVSLQSPAMHLALSLAAQLGQQRGQIEAGEEAVIAAWAGEAHLSTGLGPLRIDGNVLALSGDDARPGNSFDGAFAYSGKSSSATLLLTEDETRDTYDNLDERLGRTSGGFFYLRSGLLLADVAVGWQLTPAIRPALVVGAAGVLAPGNALGERWVGLETDLLVDFELSEHLGARIAAIGFWPGGAAGALVNRIALGEAEPIVACEAALTVRTR